MTLIFVESWMRTAAYVVVGIACSWGIHQMRLLITVYPLRKERLPGIGRIVRSVLLRCVTNILLVVAAIGIFGNFMFGEFSSATIEGTTIRLGYYWPKSDRVITANEITDVRLINGKKGDGYLRIMTLGFSVRSASYDASHLEKLRQQIEALRQSRY